MGGKQQPEGRTTLEEQLQQMNEQQREGMERDAKEQQHGIGAQQKQMTQKKKLQTEMLLQQQQLHTAHHQQQGMRQQQEEKGDQPAQPPQSHVQRHRQQQLLRRCGETAAAAAGRVTPAWLRPAGAVAASSALRLGCSLVVLLLLQCSFRRTSEGEVLPFFLLQPAACFNVQAQEAASMTTLSGLNATANQALRRLLNGKDLADVAGWAHRVAEKYPDTERLGFMQQPACPSTHLDLQSIKLDTSACQHQGNCLLEAVTYFFFQLVDPMQNTVAQTDPEVMSTNNFVFPHGIQTTDADSVKYTINLIGDLHSPLHLGSADDRFGRRLVVQYHDGMKTQLTSFAHYFEEALVQKTIRQRQYFWYSGWTHVNSIKGPYESEKTLFALNKEKMFMRWAIENRAVLCNEIYPHVRKTGKDARAAAAALGAAAVDRHAVDALAVYPKNGTVPLYEISPAAEYALFEVLRKRILLAGARTAVVMNYILQVRQQKDLGKLRQGTGVADVVDAVEPPVVAENRSLMYLKNFLINIAIFIVIFLFFVYISRFYSSPPAHPPGPHTEPDTSSPTSKPAAAAAVTTPGRQGVEMQNIKNN